ncbi:proline-rich protein PRCC-like [Mizuhopecten yessoensis]|uniref:Proline-rich protein PRCC n=1 Tax=Mizuhopecten yessoensis TaxID=6573 RepID=A0A210QE42_MIZYE|nr:proline-rich protein PRCC-like [Mizuhopecten yessoensis]OWF46948.1 Proline-rich protein PRCC [Mizuhopecten yessoensis]
MSLVAYASSGDESDESEEAPVMPTADVVINKEPRATPADEEESHEHQKPASATSVSEAGHFSDSDSEGEQETDHDTTINNTQEPNIGSLLKGLPEPKAYDDAAIPDKNQKAEEDLEEEVKPKLSQIKDAPKPPPKRAKVRITIPALQNDSDEEKQVTKKPKLSSNVKSGLTALLPAPVHAATKETNRILLPYTLKKPQEKKKPEPSKTDKVTSNPHPKFQGLPSYESDSDGDEADSEATNFFSLGGSETLAAGPVLPEPFPMQKTSKLSLPPPKMSQTDNSETIDLKSASDTTGSEVTSMASEDLVDTEQPNMASAAAASSMFGQDEPLSFKSGNWNTMSAPYHVPYGGYGSDSETSPMATEMAGPQMDYVQYEAGPQYSQNYEKDAEFLRMQGKKQRGKEEINIVDVNADDFISAVDIQKAMSEETKGEYAAHRKKDGPTSQQKRKHHITYLAHQAKETELELKNQWSMNRMTKRQTQAKYGF